MSQRFNLNFDEMRRKNAESATDEDPQLTGTEQGTHYPSYGNGRDLIFVPLKGKIIALSYSFLIAKESDLSFTQLELTYTTHIVTIKGYNLKSLLFDIVEQRLRMLYSIDERYNALQPDGDPVVNDISVVPC